MRRSVTARTSRQSKAWPRPRLTAASTPDTVAEHRDVVGPVDGRVVPRYTGLSTFARLPRVDDVAHADVAVFGVPFDSGVSYRPGARFGPAHIRQSSRLLRPYNPALDVGPFAGQQVADAGDVACNPFNIAEAITQIETAGTALLERGARLMALGGD